MNRCIFCMGEIQEKNQRCSRCGRGSWEYSLKEGRLEPYTLLQRKYQAGAVFEEGENRRFYIGYDVILEQKIRIGEYEEELWRQEKEQEAKKLFGKFDLSGIPGVRDYFFYQGKGYTIAPFQEGENFAEYLSDHKKFGEETAARLLLPVAQAVQILHLGGLICGRLIPEAMTLAEGEVLVLTGDFSQYLDREKDSRGAPEQYEKQGKTGPWTDVYGLCALWYELLTGHRVPEASERRKRDRLKPPSRYVPVGQRTEEALMQGLSMEIQERFFSCQALLEAMGLSEPGVGSREMQQIWGERWLLAAEQSREEPGKKRRKAYLWKRILAAALFLFLMAGGTAGGIHLYVASHPEEYFLWKAEQAEEKGIEWRKGKLIRERDPEYESVLSFARRYGETEEGAEEDENAGISYEIPEEALGKCSQLHSTVESFLLDYSTAKRAAEYYLDLEKKMNLQKEWYTGSIYAYSPQEGGALQVNLGRDVSYRSRQTGEILEYSYDAADGCLTEIAYTGSREKCALFLEKMISLLIPETYLTGKEAEELMEEAEAETEDSRLYLMLAANYSLELGHPYNWDGNLEEPYFVKVSPIWSTYQSWKTDGTVYAGNYEKGGALYETYLSYVKERGSRKETEEISGTDLTQKEARLYELEEEDVLAWGAPCNDFRFFTKAQEALKRLEEKGYQLEKVEESRTNTVQLQKYGGILTSFRVVERYQIWPEVYLAVAWDRINQDILQMMVYREQGSDARIEEPVWELLDLLLEEEELENPLTPEEIREQELADDSSRMVMIENTSLWYDVDGAQEDGIYLSPAALYGKSYYWPQN